MSSLGSVNQRGLKFSTTGNSDTHEDFQPTSKIGRSDNSLQDLVRQVGLYISTENGVFSSMFLDLAILSS